MRTTITISCKYNLQNRVILGGLLDGLKISELVKSEQSNRKIFHSTLIHSHRIDIDIA